MEMDRMGSAAAGVLCFWAFTALAHEHWVDVDDFLPAPDASVTVSICSGHYFPKSSFALKDEVLHAVELLAPNGRATAVQTTVTDRQRTGTVRLEPEGVYILRVALKRPRARKPSYEAKAILIAGEGSDDATQYAIGRGLELVPSRVLSELKPGDELPLVFLLDGRRVAGSLEASVEGGKSVFLKAKTDKPAALRLTRAGRCLVTANVQGRGCSLVFRVPASRKEAP
jgi:hypothetical protein